MTTGKTIALIRWTFVGKVKPLLFNMLFRFRRKFSSKEQASFNFMAAVTIYSGFGSPKDKVCHYFHYFPIYLPWSDELTYFLSLLFAAAATAKSLRSCPTLCDPTDGSPPGSSVPGTLQARTLEWLAISFSNAWKWKVKVKSLSRARLSVTPWTAAYQAPPSMGFSRQEHWSGSPLPSRSLLFRD